MKYSIKMVYSFFCLVILIILLMFKGLNDFMNKEYRARIFTQEHRNSFLINETKVITTAIGNLVDSDFQVIILKNNRTESKSIFKKKYSKYNHLPFYFIPIEKSIYFDLSKNSKIYTQIYFYYSPFENFFLLTVIYFLVISVCFPVTVYIYNNIKRFYELNIEAKQNRAVLMTIQMLAHDVRKPFSMIQGLIRNIQDSNNSEEIKSLAATHLPTVNYSIASVNGMISDVMYIGSNQLELKPEPTRYSSLINSALFEVFSYKQNSNIQIEYKLDHRHMILVDPLKMVRVISNILNNAAQAMAFKGRVWLKTEEIRFKNKHYIKICIGNSNSFIQKEDLEMLFDAFYTRNKKDGTGLGLAIAKKIVVAHGGEIWCKSEQGLGVEFFLTLPLSETKDNIDISDLPKSSKDVLIDHSSSHLEKEKEDLDQEIVNLERKIKEEFIDLEDKLLRIVAIDDEAIYRHLIKSIVPSTSLLRNMIDLKTFSSPRQANNYISNNIDLVLMDVDLGDPDISGFEACEVLRGSGYKNKICIHSNRGTFEYNKKAIRCGADIMLPKPLSKEHFLGLILSIAKEKNKTNYLNQSHCTDVDNSSLSNLNSTQYIIILDDTNLILKGWEIIAKSVKQFQFKCPEEFYEKMKLDKSFLEKSLCVVTDNDFGEKSNITGFDIAKKLKELKYSKPIYLFSNGIYTNNEINGLFNKRLPKDAEAAWKELKKDLNLS